MPPRFLPPRKIPTRVALMLACLLLSGPTGCSGAPTEGEPLEPASMASAVVQNTWTLSTSLVQKQVQLIDNHLRMTSLKDLGTGRELVQGGTYGVEFQVSVNGTPYNGDSVWTLHSHATSTGPQGERLTDITLRNAVLEVHLRYTAWPGTRVIEQFVEYKNLGGSAVTLMDPEILDTRFLSADIAAGRVDFSYTTGGNNSSSALTTHTESTSTGWKHELMNDTAWGSDRYLQHGIFHDRVANDGVMIGWSHTGQWFTRFAGDGRHQVDAHGANNTSLAPGATYTMPPAWTLVFKGGVDEAGNDLKDYQYRYKWQETNDRYVGAVKPYLWNGSYTRDDLLSRMGWFRAIGVDIFHIDADWLYRYGDWTPKSGVTDFGEANRLAKRSGMNLMVWMPAWDADATSQVATANPGWFATQAPEPGAAPDLCTLFGSTAMTRQLNLSNSGAVTWMWSELLARKTDAWGAWLWRQDFGNGALTSAGVNQIRANSGFFEALAGFRSTGPGVGINVNNCGGRQMSVESLRHSEIVQTTDGANGHHSIYTPTYFFPPDKLWGTTQGPVNLGWGASTVQLRAQLGSAWQWNSNGAPSMEQVHAFRRNADLYHFMNAKGVAGRYSRMYHPRVSGDAPQWYLQRMNQDNTQGVIIPLHGFFNSAGVYVFPKALDPAANYTVRFQNSGHTVTNTGAYWMANGIGSVDWGGDLVWLNLVPPGFPGGDTVAPSVPLQVSKSPNVYMGQPGVDLNWKLSTDDKWVSYYDVFRDGAWIGMSARVGFFFDPGGSLSSSYQVRSVDGNGNASALATAVAEGGTNFAAGQPVTSSGAETCCGWDAAKVTDGVTANALGYSSPAFTQRTPPSPVWVQVDLGADRTLSSVKLFPRTDALAATRWNTSANYPVRFVIEGATSAAPTSFKTLYTEVGAPNPKGQGIKYTFPRSTARYLRVTATWLGIPTVGEPGAYRMQLAEIEAR